MKSFAFTADDGRGAMLTAMVMIWGLRLSSFLFVRVLKDGKDRRFNVARHSPPLFFAFWTIQGLWIIIGAMPGEDLPRAVSSSHRHLSRGP